MPALSVTKSFVVDILQRSCKMMSRLHWRKLKWQHFYSISSLESNLIFFNVNYFKLKVLLFCFFHTCFTTFFIALHFYVLAVKREWLRSVVCLRRIFVLKKDTTEHVSFYKHVSTVLCHLQQHIFFVRYKFYVTKLKI